MRGSEEEEEAVASGPGQWVSTLAAHAPTRAHATSPRVQARARLYEYDCWKWVTWTGETRTSPDAGQKNLNYETEYIMFVF